MVPAPNRPSAAHIAFAVFCFGLSAVGAVVLIGDLVLVASGRLPIVVGMDRSVSVPISPSPDVASPGLRRGFNVKIPAGWQAGPPSIAAATYTIEGGRGFVSMNVVCVQGDQVFQVQLSAPAGDFDGLQKGAFASYLSSWHWQ
jgi:hypothetical protein